MSAAKPPAARPRARADGLPRWHNSFLHFRRWRLLAVRYREQMTVRNGPILASKNRNGTAWGEDVMQRANHRSRENCCENSFT
jgi:hypothetical protein